MVFAVVVDVPVEAAAGRAIATCNAALGRGQCLLASESQGASPDAARWYAVVRYGDDGQARLTIELYEGNASGARVASSELEFKQRDAADERWASVGVVVAALVLAQPPDRKPVEKKSEPVPVAPPARVLVQPPPSRQARTWLRLDLGLTAGSEIRGAPLRFGPLARASLAFSGAPVFAQASAAYTLQSSGSLALNWFTGSLGAGVDVGFAHERALLSLRGEAVIETVGMVATEGERTERARRTRFGPRFGLDLCGYWAENWALLIGGEAGVLGPRVVIDVGNRTEQLPPFVWGFLSALRYDFR